MPWAEPALPCAAGVLTKWEDGLRKVDECRLCKWRGKRGEGNNTAVMRIHRVTPTRGRELPAKVKDRSWAELCMKGSSQDKRGLPGTGQLGLLWRQEKATFWRWLNGLGLINLPQENLSKMFSCFLPPLPDSDRELLWSQDDHSFDLWKSHGTEQDKKSFQWAHPWVLCLHLSCLPNTLSSLLSKNPTVFTFVSVHVAVAMCLLRINGNTICSSIRAMPCSQRKKERKVKKW